MNVKSFVVIAHDIRSCLNIGSLLRTADGLGVDRLYLTGYTPYPSSDRDDRLPHQSKKIHNQIHKSALGAEDIVNWVHDSDVDNVIKKLKDQGYEIFALEQNAKAINLAELRPPQKIALLLGSEVEGIDSKLLNECDQIIEIPMRGKKESYNVVQAFAMAGYQIQFGQFVK